MNQNQIQELLKTLDGPVANQVANFLKDHEKVKRPRGRPLSKAKKNTPKAEEKKEEPVPVVAEEEPVKKEEAVQAPVVAVEEPVKKKRGRPLSKAKKNTPKKEEPVPAIAVEEPVKKEEAVQAPVVAVEEPVKKKRGRPLSKAKKNTPKKEEPVPAIAVEEPVPAVAVEEPVPAVAEEVPKERKPRKEKEEVNMDLLGDLEALTFTRWIFQEGSSNKFWECADKDNVTLVRYGKVGSKGTLQQKTLTDDVEAAEFLKKEILGKIKKGYVRVSIRLCEGLD